MKNNTISILLLDRKYNRHMSRPNLDMADERLTVLAMETASHLGLREKESMRIFAVEEHDHIGAHMMLVKKTDWFQFKNRIEVYPTSSMFICDGKLFTQGDLILWLTNFFRPAEMV